MCALFKSLIVQTRSETDGITKCNSIKHLKKTYKFNQFHFIKIRFWKAKSRYIANIRFSHLLIFELWLLFRVRSKQQCFEIRIEPSNNDCIFIYVLRLFGCDKFYQKEVIFPFSFRNSNFSIRRRANNKAVHWALSHWRFRRIYCVFYNELFLNKWFITKEKSWNGLFLHWLFFGGSGRFPWTDGIDAREFRHWNNIISFLHEKRKATTARPLQCIAVYNVCTHTQALTRKSVDFIVVVFFCSFENDMAGRMQFKYLFRK